MNEPNTNLHPPGTMQGWRVFPAAILTGFLLIAACAPTVDPSRPPVIRYGQDTCAQCKQVIKDELHAAAIQDPNAGSRRFDDIGCLVQSHQSNPPGPGSVVWVHDHTRANWLTPPNVWFVVGKKIETPSGSGIVAFGSPSSASQEAEKLGGRLITLEGLLRAED